jgi:hypothetical protein
VKNVFAKQLLKTMSFELCMEIECQNAPLNVRAASMHGKNCIMKAEINFLVSKPTLSASVAEPSTLLNRDKMVKGTCETKSVTFTKC